MNETFLPTIIGKEYITDTMTAIFSLQAKQWGLGITNMSEVADMECENSKLMTEELTKLIMTQQNIMQLDQKEVDIASKNFW